MTGQDAAGNIAAQPLSCNWTVALQPGLPYVWLEQGATGASAADNVTFAMQVAASVLAADLTHAYAVTP